MKSLFVATSVLALFAILGIALAGNTVDESPKKKEMLANASPSCCHDQLCSETTATDADAKLECCAAGLVAAQTNDDACSSGACQYEDAENEGGQCCNEGAVATVKQTAKACEQCTEDCEEECESCAEDRKAVATVKQTAKACEQCAEDCEGECGSCAEDRKAAASEKQVGKACKECGEDCEKECESCAQAEKVASSEKPIAAAAKGNPQAPGRGMGHGHAGDSQHAKDHQDFFFLIEHREKIRRNVTNLPNGVETLTESDQPEVAGMIQTHVEAMYARLEHKNPIRMRDPIFRAVFSHADKIQMELEHTDHGVKVKETSEDEYVVKLIQEHAKVVSLWIKNGYAELPKNHAAPRR